MEQVGEERKAARLEESHVEGQESRGENEGGHEASRIGSTFCRKA